jgi:CheY-like chemotaxis protein
MNELYGPSAWASDFLAYGEPEPRRMSVLLVEDDIFFQARFTSLLRMFDYEIGIDRAVSTEEAKELLARAEPSHYDLIIADQFLLGNDTGLDLWNYCRYKYPLVQFLLTSGKDLQHFLTQSVDPAPEFLPKSCSNQQATDVILDSLKITTNHVDLPPSNEFLKQPERLPKTIWFMALLYIGAVYYYLGLSL